MGNGLLTDEEKPYFSLSRPLDPSLYTAQPPAYTQQFVPTAQPSVTDQPDEYRPYDVQGLVSAQFQADRGQVDKLNGMAGKFRQRAALTANALEKRRLNAQAAIWEKRAKDLVAQTGEAIADDTVDELSAVFADLKKRGGFPKTESQYHQFMFSHGYKEKEDHDAYKFVWSSYGGGQGDYAIKTLFNKDGEHININTRLGEQQARNKGYVYTTRSKSGAEKYDAFSFHGPNGERRKGYRKHVDGVPRYFFSDDGAAVPANWRVGSPTEQPKTSSTTGDKVPTAFQDEAFLLNLRKDLSNLTKGTPEYKLAAEELQTYENAYTNKRWEGASTQRRKWSETVGEFSYTSDLINRMFTQLNDPSVTTGALASGLGFFEGISSQVKQGYELGVESFLDAVGAPALPAGTLNSADLYNWKDAAEASGAFKANITDLAYSLARMAEPGGRLSTPDVQNQINRIAPQGRMSKSGIAQALLEIDVSMQRRLRGQYAGLKAAGLPIEDFQFPREKLQRRSLTDPKTGQQFHALVYKTNQQVKNAKGEMEDGYAVVLQWPVGN